MNLDLDKLEIDKIYTITSRTYTYIFKNIIKDVKPYLQILGNSKVYSTSTGFRNLNYDTIIDSPIEDILWLEQCILANKYVDYIPHIPNKLDDLIKQSKELYNL